MQSCGLWFTVLGAEEPSVDRVILYQFKFIPISTYKREKLLQEAAAEEHNWIKLTRDTIIFWTAWLCNSSYAGTILCVCVCV